MTSISSPMHSGAFNLESKFQNNLFTLRMAIQCRPKRNRNENAWNFFCECFFLSKNRIFKNYSRRNGNTIKPNLYSDGTFMMNPSMFDVSMQNGSLFKLKLKMNLVETTINCWLVEKMILKRMPNEANWRFYGEFSQIPVRLSLVEFLIYFQS